MVEIRQDLKLALEADDRERLDRIIADADPDDFATLQGLIESPEASSTYRRRALYALGQWPDRGDEAATAIRAALPRLDEIERIGAVNALGRIGTPAALDAVLEYADDPAPDVRRQVATAVKRIAPPDAEQRLRQLAETDEVEHVRKHAERLLERQGGAG